jgi:MarR family transcriptional regulator, organic hydroperoxide resistance regulator
VEEQEGCQPRRAHYDTGSMSTSATHAKTTLTEEIIDLVFEFVGRMGAHLDSCAAGFDLSPPQALALLSLDEPRPMGDLAQRLRCDASNVTGIVDRLESRDLVERRVDGADRRVKNLVLTDTGTALLDRLKARLLQDVPAIGSLSKTDQRALRDLLRRAFQEA